MKPIKTALLGLMAWMVSATVLWAQEINLDKPTKCGDMLCYPLYDDPNTFYYLPDRPRLAYKDGKPQFSFLKYARLKEATKAGIGETGGGGIVHFLVTYGASPQRVLAAQESLRQTYPEATLKGPVVYRKGHFALVTSFTKDNTTFTKAVAVGKAPLMEGQKAAVSIALTKEGAEILWESFKSATPDISLVFEMEFAGIREPYEATIEGDWKRIADSHRLKAGFKYAWFGADVDMLFQELRQSGAIKITAKGDDKQMDDIIESANNYLLKMMFEPAPPDVLTRAEQEKGGYSNLDKALELLKLNRKMAKEDDKQTQSFAVPPGYGPNFIDGSKRIVSDTSAMPTLATPAYADLLDAVMEGAKQVICKEKKEPSKPVKCPPPPEPPKKPHESLKHRTKRYTEYIERRCTVTAGDYCEFINQMSYKRWRTCSRRVEYLLMHPRYLDEERRRRFEAIQKLLKRRGSCNTKDIAEENYRKGLDCFDTLRRKGFKTDMMELSACRTILIMPPFMLKTLPEWKQKRVLQMIAVIDKHLSNTTESTHTAQTERHETSGDDTHKPRPSTPAATDRNATERSHQPHKPASTHTPNAENSHKGHTKKEASKTKKEKEKGKKRGDQKGIAKIAKKMAKPHAISLVASYRLRHIKRSGHFKMTLNRYRTENQAFIMSENIGDLYGRYGHDRSVFRAVLIDDPVFKQRDIFVTLDGQDANTFTRHINFVTVRMKKVHQNGETTTDEVVITPELFNAKGNNFVLRYGWKGDNDREAWLKYQIKATWSFHGGVEIETPWQSRDDAMVALTPPFHYRTITVEGEGGTLRSKGVRHAVIEFTSTVGGRKITDRITIKNEGTAPSAIVDIPEGPKGKTVAVITWHLKGGKTVTSKPIPVEGDILYWDELEG